MSTAEKYLKPEVIRQIKRLDLRAQFIVKGFLHGLHASPFHGFSVEFSEHRKYTPGDDPKDIDWLVYAKTDKYYVKKFEAETNITGYLVMDLSRSMGYTYRQELTKFDYSICLAAALCYLMIHQQDPVGLLTFDQKIRQSLRPKTPAQPPGRRALAAGQPEAGGRDRHRPQPDPGGGHAAARQPGDDLFRSAGRARAGPRVALPAAARRARRDPVPHPRRGRGPFPFEGMVELEDPETQQRLALDADGFRRAYLAEVEVVPRHATAASAFRPASTTCRWTPACRFDRALAEYLMRRSERG